jgi:hypothetical protein
MKKQYDYITESNIKKLILFNSLICRPELQNLTIKELKYLSDHCYVSLANTDSSIKKRGIKRELDDGENIFQSFEQVNEQILDSFLGKQEEN